MSSLHRKSLIATAAIFCCRFTGLLREITYTALFGATGALDAFLTAFRVPNMLRDMFAEGALSQSFTSVMSKVEQAEGRPAAWDMAHRVVSQLMSLMVCIVAAGALLAGACMKYLYPERAGIEVELRDPLLTELITPVGAVYQGMKKNADGLSVACFLVDQPVLGLTEQSCVRVSRLEKLHVGQDVMLSTVGPAGENFVRVEERSFLGMATDLCRIMWPFILLASLSALSMGALNVFGIFGLPNMASAAFNLTTISVGLAIGWWIDPLFGPEALYGFAIAVVLGGAAQLLVQVPKLYKNGYRPRWDIGLAWRKGRLAFTDDRVRTVWGLMIPGAIAAGITQTNIFVNTSFALYLPGGSVTALSGAFHLWQLPVALFGVAVGMVVLPSVSRMTLTRGNAAISEQLAIALRFVAFFAVPSMVLLGVWGEGIVSVFFQRGRFTPEASALTGQVLAAYSLGLLGYAGMKVLQPVFLALEKPWAPAGLAIAACALSIGLNYTFVHVLGLGASWLALTTSCITTLNFLFFYLYLRHLLGSMAWGTLWPGLLRIGCAGALLAGFCIAVHAYFLQDITQWDFSVRLGAMAAAGAAAGVVYLLAALACRVPELDFVARKLLRRR